MLNEIKEYAQYTDVSVGSDPIVKCLKYKLLVANGFSGIEQAMVTIARHFLFDCTDEYTAEEIAAAENALRLWCGGHDEPIEKTRAIQNWLPTYIKRQLLYEKVQSVLSDGIDHGEDTEEPHLLPEAWTDIVNSIQAEINHPSENSIELLQNKAAILKAFIKDKQFCDCKDIFQKYAAPILYAINRLPKITVLRSNQTLYSQAKLPQAIEKYKRACDPNSRSNDIPASYLEVIHYINDLLNGEKLDVQEEAKLQSWYEDCNKAKSSVGAKSLQDTDAEENEHTKELGVDEQLQACAMRIRALKETEKIDADFFNSNILPIVKCIDALKALEGKRKSYAKAMFRAEVNAYEAGKYNNDFKAITYDSVIATGCNLGPLQRYYLCCDDESLIRSVYISGKKERGLNAKEKDVLLKTVASWILSGARPNRSGDSMQQHYRLFNQAAVINWANGLSFYDDYKDLLESFRMKSGNQTEVFSTINPGGNCTKLAVISQTKNNAAKGSSDNVGQTATWLNHFSIRCAVHHDADQAIFEEWKKDNPNGVFYRDDGAGSCLVENALYD